jgi:hypothetical protein
VSCFSDVQTPGHTSGVALARWVARDRPEVRVLLTSGDTGREATPEWPVMSKPYSLGEIECRLRDLLRPH